MKRLLLATLTILSINCFSQINLFNEKTNLKINTFLADEKINDDFGDQPLLVIDGKPILIEEIENYNDLQPENILEINSMSKKSRTGKIIWGKNAKDGVLMIKTNLIPHVESKSAEKRLILYVLDDKIISEEAANHIDAQKDIQTIDVYKEVNKFKLFNEEEYDGIMVLTSKKK